MRLMVRWNSACPVAIKTNTCSVANFTWFYVNRFFRMAVIAASVSQTNITCIVVFIT